MLARKTICWFEYLGLGQQFFSYFATDYTKIIANNPNPAQRYIKIKQGKILDFWIQIYKDGSFSLIYLIFSKFPHENEITWPKSEWGFERTPWTPSESAIVKDQRLDSNNVLDNWAEDSKRKKKRETEAIFIGIEWSSVWWICTTLFSIKGDQSKAA